MTAPAAGLFGYREPRRVHVVDIQRAVSGHFNVPMAALLSDCRQAQIARPRQIAMYLAKQMTRCSLPDIGRRFGRDHSTVLHAVRRIEGLRGEDAGLAADLRALEGVLS